MGFQGQTEVHNEILSKKKQNKTKRVQQLKVLTVLSEDLSSMPSIHIRQLTTISNSYLQEIQCSLIESPGSALMWHIFNIHM